VQDEITQATTIAIAPAIAATEQQRAMRKPPASLDAWGAYQRGMWHLSKASAEDDTLAEEFFQRAIDLDPMFVGGYIGLAGVLSRAKGTQSKEEAALWKCGGWVAACCACAAAGDAGDWVFKPRVAGVRCPAADWPPARFEPNRLR
jgi:hypothetical protein